MGLPQQPGTDRVESAHHQDRQRKTAIRLAISVGAKADRDHVQLGGQTVRVFLDE